MKFTQNITLIPVLELAPSDFSTVDRESPKKSYLEAPEAWLKYNQSCYNDAGLLNIKSIEPLSWLFEIDSLSIDALKIILKNSFDRTAEDFDSITEVFNDPVEYAPLIAGGYLFVVDGIIKSQPGCCCGLEGILEWETEGNVFTGHGEDDFVTIKVGETKVEVSSKGETFLIKKTIYSKMIEKTKAQIDVFIHKSGIILNDLFKIQNGQFIVRAMIYKWD